MSSQNSPERKFLKARADRFHNIRPMRSARASMHGVSASGRIELKLPPLSTKEIRTNRAFGNNFRRMWSFPKQARRYAENSIGLYGVPYKAFLLSDVCLNRTTPSSWQAACFEESVRRMVDDYKEDAWRQSYDFHRKDKFNCRLRRIRFPLQRMYLYIQRNSGARTGRSSHTSPGAFCHGSHCTAVNQRHYYHLGKWRSRPEADDHVR